MTDTETKAECKVISGTKVAKKVHAELKEEVAGLKEKTGKGPCLAVVLVGDRKDSQSYVRMKTKACAKVGIKVPHADFFFVGRWILL